jgi:glycerol-3-phosphate cytidylyltransferase
MKYKCGYTTGVFDLFHVGHLNLIRQSKENCDYLIVGVSSDELVVQVKGKKPVIPCSERMEILSAIKYIDKVVKQTSIEKIEDWEKYRFDVVFHGNDWENSEIDLMNATILREHNVDFVYFERGKYLSTTQICEKIKKESV